MQFGLSFLPDANGRDLSAPDYFSAVMRLSQLADEAGMCTIKMTEHYLHPYGGFCPDPLVFLAAMASCTRRIRLMTGCLLPVFHHPAKIAAKTALLDVLSQGRLDVGFARAYLPHEFKTFQVAMDGSRDLFEKTIDTVLRLWTENCVTMADFQLDAATSLPRPVQTPHPPVWGAAVMSRQSFTWLGEKGFNLLVTPPLSGMQDLQEKIALYRAAFATSHPDKQARVALSMPLLMAKTSQQAIRLSDQYLQRYLDVWADATAPWATQVSSDYPAYTGLGALLRAMTPEKMRHNFQALVGTPEMIQEKLTQMAEWICVDQIIWQIDFGTQPERVSHQTLSLFLENMAMTA